MHAPLPYTTRVVFTLLASGWLVVCSIIGVLARSADKDDQLDCAS